MKGSLPKYHRLCRSLTVRLRPFRAPRVPPGNFNDLIGQDPWVIKGK